MKNKDFGQFVISMPVKSWMNDATQSSITTIETALPQAQPPEPQFILSSNQLSSEIKRDKEAHKRPMTSAEYDELFNILKTGVDKNGNNVFSFEQAAIARVMKENISKFDPELAIDPTINDALNEASHLDIAFHNKYYDALAKWRELFLKESKEIQTAIPSRKKKIVSNYTHPMLKYGLV